mmetsp:Transcript_14032/g.35364  ORF Transcript_14032/g.35364 Transcript_14032/m.35364 type:complete len:270 (-) Transcript_14032:1827-2636(-)
MRLGSSIARRPVPVQVCSSCPLMRRQRAGPAAPCRLELAPGGPQSRSALLNELDSLPILRCSRMARTTVSARLQACAASPALGSPRWISSPTRSSSIEISASSTSERVDGLLGLAPADATGGTSSFRPASVNRMARTWSTLSSLNPCPEGRRSSVLTMRSISTRVFISSSRSLRSALGSSMMPLCSMRASTGTSGISCVISARSRPCKRSCGAWICHTAMAQAARRTASRRAPCPRKRCCSSVTFSFRAQRSSSSVMELRLSSGRRSAT